MDVFHSETIQRPVVGIPQQTLKEIQVDTQIFGPRFGCHHCELSGDKKVSVKEEFAYADVGLPAATPPATATCRHLE